MAYATVADVRNAVETPASDADITAALAYAEQAIYRHTGRRWGTAVGTRYFYDVRSAIVPVYEDFSNVTEVRVGSYVLPTTQYEVYAWGVKFALTSWARSGGAVAITATFGTPVHELVKEAAVVLAGERLSVTNPWGSDTAVSDGSVIPELPANVASFSVEGLSVAFDNTGGGNRSTGNSTADDLLALLVRPKVGFV